MIGGGEGGGNLLMQIGLDIKLLTAGAAGGLVKAIFDHSKVIDGTLSMVAGSLTANYFGAPFAQLVASGAVFGMKLNITDGVAGFFVGMFAVTIVGILAAKLRSKIDGEPK